MKIYIEGILLLNFLLDFMILYGTKKLLKINIITKRIIISSLFGSITTFILYIKISSYLLLLIKLIISILMIIISFGTKNIIRNTFYFYLISIIIGGLIYLLNLNKSTYYLLYLVFLIPIFCYLIIKELINLRINYQEKYPVILYYKNKKYLLDGFIDTGNRLKEPLFNREVVLVNLKINYNKVIYVPFKALNSRGIIPCIKPDKLIINNQEFNNYLVGIVRDQFSLNGENCILPNKLKEELCLN